MLRFKRKNEKESKEARQARKLWLAMISRQGTASVVSQWVYRIRDGVLEEQSTDKAIYILSLG